MEQRERLKLIEDFRKQRAEIIGGPEAPVKLPDGGRIILHLIPETWTEDPAAIYNVPGLKMELRGAAPFGKKRGFGEEQITFDGKITSLQRVSNAYALFFFNGIVEAVEAYYFSSNDKDLPIYEIENELFTKSLDYVDLQKEMGVKTPIFLMLTIVGAESYEILGRKLSTGKMNFPPQIITDYEQYSKDQATIIKPVFDRLWNAAGFPGSRSYEKGGQFYLG